MLSADHRAAHEPAREELLKMILRESRGDISSQGFREYLIERDARLDLEYDISWANQFVVGHLLSAFPAAKFIVLIRDCNSWLKSIVGHLVGRDLPPDVLAFLKWWFQPERYPHSRHDRALETNGLFSVPAYLHAWNRHVDLCARRIPTDRAVIKDQPPAISEVQPLAPTALGRLIETCLAKEPDDRTVVYGTSDGEVNASTRVRSIRSTRRRWPARRASAATSCSSRPTVGM